MTKKSYTAEDEEFVRFVRSSHTITETAQLSGLSESTVKRILAKSSNGSVRPDVAVESPVRPDEIEELKSMIEKQNKTISRLMNMVAPPRSEYEEEQPTRKLVLGGRKA